MKFPKYTNYNQIRNQIKDQVFERARDQVLCQVKDLVLCQVKDQVWININQMGEIWSQLNGQVLDESDWVVK